MTRLKNISIGTQMLLIAIIALIGFIVIAGIYLSGAIYQDELRAEQAEELMIQKKVADTQYLFLDARRIEKGFLLLFERNYLGEHEGIVANIRENFLVLRQMNEKEANISLDIDTVEVEFINYTNQFSKIVSMWKTIGLNEEVGLRGEVRRSAHELEERLSVANEKELIVLMLMMRRHEKDFLMRIDKKYIEELLLRKKEFLNILSASSFLAKEQNNIKLLLEVYHIDFIALSELRLQISEEVENLSQLFIKTLPIFKALIVQAENRYQSFVIAVEYNSYYTMAAKSLIIMIIILICVSLAVLIGRGITRPIKQMATAMTRLADGELDVDVPIIDSRNEIGAFAESMMVFKEKLITKRYLTEIAERERAVRELELEQARDAAEAGERAKTTFFANMSHEIRTPMNAIIGFSEIVLQNKKLAPEIVKQVGIIHNSATFLLGLINSILDLSKLESGTLSLEKVSFHLPNMLKIALQLLEYQAAEKRIEINSKYADQLSSTFIGDPYRLRQVILNLVGNAIKFTEKGSVTVSVQPWKATDLLHFSIADTGIGMTEEHVMQVFERFSQADESTTRRFGGTGLGATISRQLVQLMGGEIWVESKLGQGSTFHFTIKLVVSLETDTSLYKEVGVSLDDEYMAPRKFQILLAEDDSINADLAITRLEQQGHIVTWVKSGREAVEKVRSYDYDVVLMDIMMPGLDGLEATIEIRKIEKRVGEHLPIIALTASVMMEDEVKYRTIGMDAVVAKPVCFKGLFATMENVVPEGCGQLNTQRYKEVIEAEFDFSALKEKVNYTKALKSWHSPSVYARALIAFKTERLSDAIEIKHLLMAPTNNFKPARMIAHTLKGVAGNLGIESVTDLAAEIDTELSVERIDIVMPKLDILHQSLQGVAASIERLNFPMEEPCTMKDFDSEVVRELLVKLSCALGELDPDVAEPYLDALAEYLTESDMASIRKQLKIFNFENAQTEINMLAQKFDLSIDGGFK